MAASADSFQNIFANAAAQPQFTANNPAWSDAGSNLASNWSTPAATVDSDDSDMPVDDGTANGQANASGSNSEAVSQSDSEPARGPLARPANGSSVNPNEAASGAPVSCLQSSNPVSLGSVKTNHQATTRTSQVSANPNKKVDPLGHSVRGEQSGAVSGASVTGGAVSGRTVSLPEAAGHHAAEQAATSERRANVQQAAPTSDLTDKTGSPATSIASNSNALSGSAFALHITTTGTHGDAAQKTAAVPNAAQAAQQASPAAAANPADETNSDPSALAAAPSDPAGLLVSATLASTSGAAPSRQVSALTASADSTASAGWSAPTTPMQLNDQTKPAESVAAAAPMAEVDVDAPDGPAQPVKTLQLQLGGTGDQRVDLRLIEHAGGLSVSVRASDSSLTRGLQENLPELSSRLAAEHYQTQVWLPAAGQTSAGAHSQGSFDQSPDRRGGGQSSQGGSSSGGQGNPQQDRQQDQAPAWWRQLASPGGANASVSTSVPSSSLTAAASLHTTQSQS
jgi:hypothetical protein